MVVSGKNARRGSRCLLCSLLLMTALNAGAEGRLVVPPAPPGSPAASQNPSPLERVQEQVRNQQRQHQEELLERSRTPPQASDPVRTDLPMSPQSQSLRCQRQLREIQGGERGPLSGDCQIWRREQYRPQIND